MRRGLGLRVVESGLGTWDEGDDFFDGAEPMDLDSPARPELFDDEDEDEDEEEVPSRRRVSRRRAA